MTQKVEKLSPKETKRIYESIQKLDDASSFNDDHVQMTAQSLSFAPQWSRLCCTDYSSVPFQAKDYISDGQAIRPCLYSKNPYQDNDWNRLGLVLTSETILDYLSFYMDYFISGSDGLKLVFQADDIDWQNEIGPSIRQSLQQELMAYPIIKKTDNAFLIQAPCIFRQSIMIVSFNISHTGSVEIRERKSLIDDLPIHHFS